MLQKKYVQAALVIALLGAGGAVSYIALKDKNPTKMEQLHDLTGYPFEHHHLVFWDDNEEYFAKVLGLQRETLSPTVKIIHDAGLTFYIVHPEDIKEVKTTSYIWKTTKTIKGGKTVSKKIKIPKVTITHVGDFEKIRTKLSRFSEFSYLKRSEYDRSKPGNKTKSFNIPKESMKAGMYIPIPLDNKVREISPQDFSNYCYDAIQEMKQEGTFYSKDIKELLHHTTQKDLISSMLAFARSETSSEYASFIKPLGDVELYRREPAFKAFSFSYFHILMEKNADGKTPGPGLQARLHLGLTEGQCYHPKNAAKLFLAYWIEKTNGKLKNVFPLTDDNIKKIGTKYNGSVSYVDKLHPNFVYSKKLIDGEITYYDTENLTRIGFIYSGLNSKYQHIYKFRTPKGIHSTYELKKTIVEKFNTHKADNCPSIHEDDIVTSGGKKLSQDIVPDSVCICIPTK